MRNSRSRTREAIHGLTIGILLAITAVILAICSAAHAEEVALPFANFAGYHTTLVLVNPVGQPVKLAGFWANLAGVGAVDPTVQPYESFRFPDWPHAGGGVHVYDVPGDLIPYVEIADGYGVIVRVNPLHAIDSSTVLQFQDLIVDGDFRSYLFINSPDGSAYRVSEFDHGVEVGHFGDILPPGGTAIPSVGASMVTLRPGGLSVGPFPLGHLYAFALIADQGCGPLLAVEPDLEFTYQP